MLNILGSPKRLCDGVTRREMLQAGASAVLGLGLADLVAPRAAASGVARPRNFGAAKNVMVLYLYGAMSQIDTLDPKPDAPAEIRGPFGTVATKLPSVRVGELLPRIAGRLDRVTVVRSMNHPEPIHNVANTVTGIRRTDVPMELNQRDPRHWPFFGSVIDYIETTAAGRAGNPLIPRNVMLPWRQSANAPDKRAGFFGGFLGARYDPTPLEFRGKGTVADCVEKFNPYCGIAPSDTFNFPVTALGPQVTLDRFQSRRSLLDQLNDRRRSLAGTAPAHGFDELQQIGLALCDSASLPAALSLDREPARLRERYGHHLFGQSALLGRRLIEAGSRVVTVLWDEFAANNSGWDTHNNQTRRLGRELCPGLDQTVSALLDDLEQRGLFDETLVVCLTEHGRTPQPEGKADGRNHWSGAYSIMLAGAGVARGNVVGSSDKQGAFVKTRPVNPKDILHTIYHLLGIDVERSVPDRQGRPMPLVDGGNLVPEILA
ncbi:MAG: DUF1501 domain-containing protein [Planctomycetes bacterium]|nr:DUF1501 domain-containing protein [Planctomycetota bacterium]